MNILFSSDNNYAQHLGVAIYSLLSHNQDAEAVHIYIVDNGISEDNVNRLNEMAKAFSNAEVTYISFQKWKDALELDMSWPIALSAYARLFVASMLPASVDRVLYLDCDMIVNDSLSLLWNFDMKGQTIAAIQDAVGDSVKSAVGLQTQELYFNSGMLLIDLEAWRKNNCEQKCLDFIQKRKGRVTHHDQGVLNGVFRNAWTRLPLKYNVMTIHYIFNLNKINKYFKNHAEFYDENEIMDAKINPAIIHFTPSFTTRPWVKTCKHPLRSFYWENLAKTPWEKTVPECDNNKWIVRFINWRYRTLPF